MNDLDQRVLKRQIHSRNKQYEMRVNSVLNLQQHNVVDTC